MALIDLLQDAVKRGLTDLHLHPVHSEDRKTVYWRATATPSTAHKYISVSHLDPVEALEQVLKALPKAPKRTKRDVPEVVGEELPVTAAVTREEIIADAVGVVLDDPPPNLEGFDEWLPKM